MDERPDMSTSRLFLDDTWVEESQFVSRQWHPLRKHPDPLIVAEHPWERGAPAIYGTVLHWRGKFRMWYVNAATAQPLARVCYAESDDGAVWQKPELGVCEVLGSRENNIVIDAVHPRYIDDISVIDDANDAEWPLKVLYWEGSGHDWTRQDWGIYLARSKDGVRWDRSPGLVLPQWIDRFNACATKWDGKYVLWGRTADVERGIGRNGRSVWRVESTDLVHWSEPRLVLERDAEDPLNMEYYSLAGFRYEGMMLGALERMYMTPDRIDTELVWSHDGGVNWRRVRQRPALVAPSIGERRWDDTWTNLSSGPPVRVGNRLWFYYSGRSGAHHSMYPSKHGAIGLAFLRVDGFASLAAGQRDATVLTKPMTWADADLHVNVDPRRDLTGHPAFCDGHLRVEARDAENRPIAGFSWDECVPVTRNTQCAPNADSPTPSGHVVWKDGRSLRELAGRTVRLAFRFRDAHLYSFRAGMGQQPAAWGA